MDFEIPSPKRPRVAPEPVLDAEHLIDTDGTVADANLNPYSEPGPVTPFPTLQPTGDKAVPLPGLGGGRLLPGLLFGVTNIADVATSTQLSDPQGLKLSNKGIILVKDGLNAQERYIHPDASTEYAKEDTKDVQMQVEDAQREHEKEQESLPYEPMLLENTATNALDGKDGGANGRLKDTALAHLGTPVEDLQPNHETSLDMGDANDRRNAAVSSQWPADLDAAMSRPLAHGEAEKSADLNKLEMQTPPHQKSADSPQDTEGPSPIVQKVMLQGPKSMGQDLSLASGMPESRPDQASLATAEGSKFDPEAEFEIDSSPIESSDSDSLDDSSSSDDSVDGEYQMLDPEEQARRLMAEDGGSDDENGGKGVKIPGPLRTINEKPDEIVPKPDITITEDMEIQELGRVENMVENLVLIKAKTSGDHQVLEFGSVLCLQDRTVIGVVAETLGRVQQPYYSVRFTNQAAVSEAGISKDTRIFFVEQHSTYVFTQPLKAIKGSDASNLHDEEVADDEIEFSDDEAEREYKQKLKFQRQSRREGREGAGDGFSRGSRGFRGRGRVGGRGRGSSQSFGHLLPPAPQRYPASEPALDYDDGGGRELQGKPDSDELYTPLKRPTSLYGGPASHVQTHSSPSTDVSSITHVGRGFSGRGNVGSWGQGRGSHMQANSFPPAPVFTNQSSSHSSLAQNVQTPFAGFGFNGTAQQPIPSTQYDGRVQIQQHPSQQTMYGYQSMQQHHLQSSYTQAQAYQQPPPYQTYPSGIPPGAHINPAFFQQQLQNANQPSWPQRSGQSYRRGNQR